MVEPTPKNKRLVQAYQSSNGETHKTLEAAVRADIETLFEDDLACGGDMMDYILTPKYRHKLIRLLKELD